MCVTPLADLNSFNVHIKLTPFFLCSSQIKKGVMLSLYVASGLILGVALFDHAGSEALSSCHAFCGSSDDPFSCIESHCKAMYKQRVSRFGKRDGADGSSCSAICNANLREKCTRCRAILRQRINRFGKRSPLLEPMQNYFSNQQDNGGFDDADTDLVYDLYDDAAVEEDAQNEIKHLKQIFNLI